MGSPNTAIRIDAGFKHLIPPLSLEEYAQLEANIRAEGCRDALVLWDDVLIDGHNRYEICQKHDVEFRTEQCASIVNEDDAVLWIVNNQLGRRNINDFIRADLALRARPIIEARARIRQEATRITDGFTVAQNSAEPAIETRQEVAKSAGLSHDTIRKVQKIKENATPALLDAVRSGAISINAASHVANLPVDEQSAIVSAGPDHVRKVAATLRHANVKPKEVLASQLDQLREELAAAREAAAILAEELEAYRAVDAGEHLLEIKRLQDVNRALKSQLDDYTTQNQQLKKQVKSLMRQAGGPNV